MNDLAKEWMASPHWGGWRVGMVDTDGDVYTETKHGDPMWASGGTSFIDGGDYGELPDLDHPGTCAFLLEDVRAAWGYEGAHSYRCFGGGWAVNPTYPDMVSLPTEQAALMAALRAAPEPK